MTRTHIRCAIYTRKSSEEGLDQTFNSIDAQREACEAYVVSQRHEGWTTLRERYDDGGFSGGTLDRPAIQRLLDDIRAGQVDLVVVYKIDRLTRSLADFAKMVEIFDAHSASFVSVTQHFNTTSSMGRLTLNVLLSFAQFEREVTGERIRDKIAASKKKGMWMGGTVPIGYDAVDRQLVVNPQEAETVRFIFSTYLETGNVRTVKARLDAAGIRSKYRPGNTGSRAGDLPLRPGAIYGILNNRVYLGEIPHKDAWYAGNHEAIVTPKVFEAVKSALAINLDRRRKGQHAKEPTLLAGWVTDKDGNKLIPSHALKSGKRYRYYVSRPTKEATPGTPEWITKTSIPAHDLEEVVVKTICRWLCNPGAVLTDLNLTKFDPEQRSPALRRAEEYGEKLRQASLHDQRALLLPLMDGIVVHTQEVRILLNGPGLLGAVGADSAMCAQAAQEDGPMLKVAARLRRYGLEMRLVIAEEWAAVEEPEVDQALVTALARGYSWYQRLVNGDAKSLPEIAQDEGISAGFVSKMLRGALLPPDMVEGMLDGTLVGWSSKRILELGPADWRAQRTLGMPPAH